MAETKSSSLATSTPEDISEKNITVPIPEFKAFLQYYNALAKILFSTNLVPQLIQEGVIVPEEREKISALVTSTEKAEFVLQKVSSALQAGLTESFHIVLNIMKCHGNRDAQQLSMTIKCEMAGSQKDKELQTVVIKEMDEFSLEFSALVADVAEILETSANLKKIKLVCCNITTPQKSLLLSEKENTEIRASNSVFEIFYLLRGHWRWDSHRLLFTLIKRAGSREALERLDQFRNKIYYTQELKRLADHYQSAEKPLPPGYAKMVAIIEKDYTDFTVKECDELDEYLGDAFGGILPPTLKIENSNSIKITWFIPAEAVSWLLSKAYQSKEIFQLLSISYFEVDEVVIWKEKWPYSLQNLTEKLNKNESLIAEYSTKLTQAEEVIGKRDKEIRALITEKAKLEHDSGFGSMKDSVDQADTSLPKESSADIQDINKNMEIFKLENELDEQARSFNDTLKDKDAEIDKIQSELKKKSEELQAIKQKLQSGEVVTDNMQIKSEAKIKDDQVKGQKKESIHTMKMKYDELQVKYRQNDIYVQNLKKQLDEAEDKISSLKKVIDANENRPKESDRAASDDLEEKAKQVDSFQRQLKDLEDQNRSLQEKLGNEKANVKANELKESEAAQRLKEKAKQIESLQQALHQVQNENRSLQEKAKKHMQSQGDTSTLRLQNSELSTQVTRLRAEMSQMKINYSQLDNDSKKWKEQTKTLHNKEQQEQQLMEQVREANSNVDAMKKEIFEQAKSYNGTINEKDDIIAKLQSDLRKYENKQLESEKVCRQMETEISKLKAENQKIKKPISADLGYHSGHLGTLPDDPPSQPTLAQQELMKLLREANSNIEAMKQEISDQANSYLGIIDENDNTIAKLQSDLKKSENKQLECEKACKQMETEISKLKAESQKIKKPRSADSGYHSRQLDTLPDDPPSHPTLTQHQVGAQISEAASDFTAIIVELNDQVQSYLGLLDEKDNRIKKLQDENKHLREEKVQAFKPQVERRQQKDDKEKERARTWRRGETMSMYLSSSDDSELQQIFKKFRSTDKDNQ